MNNLKYNDGSATYVESLEKKIAELEKQIESLKQSKSDGNNKVKELTDEEINVVAILQDAEIVPVGHEIWKTGEEFNKYKRIVLATAKALRKAQEK